LPQPALAPALATILRVADQTMSSNPGPSTMPRNIGRSPDALRRALGTHLVIPKRFADEFDIIQPSFFEYSVCEIIGAVVAQSDLGLHCNY
jgi:hypothetical protein